MNFVTLKGITKVFFINTWSHKARMNNRWCSLTTIKLASWNIHDFTKQNICFKTEFKKSQKLGAIQYVNWFTEKCPLARSVGFILSTNILRWLWINDLHSMYSFYSFSINMMYICVQGFHHSNKIFKIRDDAPWKSFI